jgi:hypothetical protein
LFESPDHVLRHPGRYLCWLGVAFAVAGSALASPLISEFMAVNLSGLTDEDGATSDWIEIHNPDGAVAELGGWSLTDDPGMLTKWTFPPGVSIPANSYLVVYASGKDRSVAGAELHTNFALDGDGEYLALVGPESAVVHEYTAEFVEQFPDVSYGIGTASASNRIDLLREVDVRYLVPGPAVDDAWKGGAEPYDDSAWTVAAGTELSFDDESMIAYRVAAGTPGNQAYGGALGMDFVVGAEVEISHLGAFDDGSDGMGRIITVELWSRNDKGTPDSPSDDNGIAVLATLDFTPGSPGTLGGGLRFKPLGSPLVLAPGAYTIVAHGYGSGELNGNSASGFSATEGGNSLSFTGSSRYGPAGTFPGTVDKHVSEYGAGSFKFIPGSGLRRAMLGISASVFARYRFDVNDPGSFAGLDLAVDYDDGWVAWLNGLEVARVNAPAGSPSHDSSAPVSANGTAHSDLSAHLGDLAAGENVLAIQGLNVTAADGDFLMEPGLSGIRNSLARVFFPSPTPGAANGVGVSYPGVLINEIHYNSEDKTRSDEFIELHNAGAASVDLSGWQFTGGVRFVFPGGTTLASGGYLVIASSPADLLAEFGVPALGPFTGRLSSDGETVELRDAAAAVVDRVDFQVGFPWPTTGDAPYNSMELVHPKFDNDLGGSWRASSGSPTPGGVNSVFAEDNPPQTRQVMHLPERPVSAAPVTITAKVSDPDGVASVTLHHRVVDPGSYVRLSDAAYETGWTDVPMVDDGTGGDLLANDSIFTAVLPAAMQRHRRLVRYRITVADSLGQSVRLPYADDPQPNFAYFVYDGIPDWSGADRPGVTPVETFGPEVMNAVPAYHLIAVEADVLASQFNAGSRHTHFYGTLVHDDEVYDHIQFNIRGEYSTYVVGKNKWRIRFRRGHWFKARDNFGNRLASGWKHLKFNAGGAPWTHGNRGMAGVEECLSFRLFGLAGVPSSRTHYFQLRVIDDAREADPRNQYGGDLWGLYYAVERPDGGFLEDRELPDGNVYKLESPLNKDHQGAGEPSGFTDIEALRSSMSTSRSETWWRDRVDHATYARFKAVSEAITHYDQRDGMQGYFFHNPGTGKWQFWPWDLDTMFQLTGKYYTWDRFRLCLDPRYSNNYRDGINEQREVLDLLFNAKAVDTVMGEFIDLVNPTGQALTLADLDRHMWNFHPRMNNKGTHNRLSATANPGGATYTRTLTSADFEGQMGYMRAFLQPGGFGYEKLVEEVADGAIPDTPTVSYTGRSGFPMNDLRFRSSAFSDAGGSFAAMKWRIGEVSDLAAPNHDPLQVPPYEIDALWETESAAFLTDVAIPPTNLRVGSTYRVRVKHQDSTGRWSHWSAPVEFTTSVPDISNYQQNLVVSEVMYNPAPVTPAEFAAGLGNDDFEFIELLNIGGVSLDLGSVRFTDGITATLAGALAPGERIVLVRSRAAFEARYGTSIPVLGEYSGKLNNGGETITLSFGRDQVIRSFAYSDTVPWPEAAAGDGGSLVLIAPETNPDHALPRNWRPSALPGGNPGTSDAVAFVGDPLVDVDGDGLAALLEHALGSSDLSSGVSSVLPAFNSTGEFLVSFPRNIAAEDVAIEIQLSDNLVDWSPAGVGTTFIGSADQGGGIWRETWRILENPAARRFVRLSVSQR